MVLGYQEKILLSLVFQDDKKNLAEIIVVFYTGNLEL